MSYFASCKSLLNLVNFLKKCGGLVKDDDYPRKLPSRQINSVNWYQPCRSTGWRLPHMGYIVRFHPFAACY